VRVAREATPFALGFGIVALAVAFWSVVASLVPLALLAFCLFFFRDPERRSPPEPDAVLSPADGRVLLAEGGRVSVFLSVFDVHVCRAPLPGAIRSVTHLPGRFLAAFRPEASEQNERTSIVVERGDATRLTFTLVAGLVARRIVCKVAPGQHVASGERIGLIRFGSRVDVELPAGASIVVRRGDRVSAGETIIARLE
jgi:phosphatidylserine decarboxylase